MLSLNTTRFKGSQLSLSELQHTCDSVPFLAKRRLVIVEDLLKSKPAFLDELTAYLHRLPETTLLIFLESGTVPPDHPVFQLAKASKDGYVRLHQNLDDSQLIKWVKHRVEESGGRITRQANHLLVTNVGNNLDILANEVEKLVLYKGDQEIQPADVELLCPYVAEAGIFDLVDEIGKRDARKASLLLNQKLQEGTDPGYLFSMIIRQFRLLIQVKELVLGGANKMEVARALKIHAYPAEKLFRQSSNFPIDQLEYIYSHLLATDVKVKTGQAELVTALNLLVAGITI